MGHLAGNHEVGAGEELRSCRVGDSTQLLPQLGGDSSAIAGPRSPPRQPHLLGQPRADHVEVPREGPGAQDRPSHARPRSSLPQVTVNS